mgnify:CR=1 FL=1
MNTDPYTLSEEDIQEPPSRFWDQLKFLGPGFILSASIVGSGELIATTTLGARAGFITFWVILVSCIVKVAVQIEFGRHTILTGETAMVAFNRLPGPRWGRARWAVWVFFALMLFKPLQVGGIVGGVAIILNMVVPAVPLAVWAFAVAIVVALMIYRGYYRFIERFSLWMFGFFTLFTLAALFFLRYTSFAISWADVASGLQFELPRAAVAVALGAFGITGVGGDEILAYSYWCLEKGYAAYSGPPDGSPDWRRRARGWIRPLELDATIAMVIYTLMTAAFYLLGAAVLHAQGTIPEGYRMVESLSAIYTESLGPGARTAFLIGAFVVLFSTLFAALAAWTRQYSDIFGQLGWIDFFDPRQRRRSIAVLGWVFPLLWASLFVFIQLPVAMVLAGGVVTSIILFLVLYAVLYFRYWDLDPAFRPTLLYDLALWISVAFIVFVGAYGVYRLF